MIEVGESKSLFEWEPAVVHGPYGFLAVPGFGKIIEKSPLSPMAD